MGFLNFQTHVTFQVYVLNFLYVAINGNPKVKLIYFIFFRIVHLISRLRIVAQMVLKN